MSLRSQATALIGRFISDIDAIIREHAERATHLALKQHGLPPRRAKRLERQAPSEPVAPSRPAPQAASEKRRSKAQKTARAPARKARKRRAKVPAEQLSLF